MAVFGQNLTKKTRSLIKIFLHIYILRLYGVWTKVQVSIVFIDEVEGVNRRITDEAYRVKVVK